MVLDKEGLYMHPETGAVDTGEQWMKDQIEMDFPISDLDNLIPVELDSMTGQYKEWEA